MLVCKLHVLTRVFEVASCQNSSSPLSPQAQTYYQAVLQIYTHHRSWLTQDIVFIADSVTFPYRYLNKASYPLV